MELSKLVITKHARTQMQKRSITEAEVNIVCRIGQYERLAGVICFFVGRRQVSALDRSSVQTFPHLEGVTVLCCSRCHRVITVYHNLQGRKAHRHKKKYNKKQHQQCPMHGKNITSGCIN